MFSVNFTESIKNTVGLLSRFIPTLSSSEKGTRSTTEQQLYTLYQNMQPSFVLYRVIQDIRAMDQEDGHVKRIHHITSHGLTKSGLILKNPKKNKRLDQEWDKFKKACELNKRAKLASDAKGLLMEGNLPLQWVLDKDKKNVVRAIRMPAETIRPQTDQSGQFKNPSEAYKQYCYLTNRDIATFALWQLTLVRLDPLNHDDLGEMGRPFLDSIRKRWRQLNMTFDDLVIRRRERAPLRTAHILEGANKEELAAYKQEVESDQRSITTNYYLNKQGAVQAVQGDENLDQIKDISLLLDAFFTGTPVPKGLLGYADELSRDVLQDMKEAFYEELDILQDLLTGGYEEGFKLHLLLKGINPDQYEWSISYKERLTESLTQRTDRALKLTALGASRHTAFTEAGLDPTEEEERLSREEVDPVYPNGSAQNVTITEGGATKGNSATSISND